MKARVKATGEIVEVQDCNGNMYVEKFGEVSGRLFHITELDFDNLDTPDYWTRLEHTYAGMAMQGILTNLGNTISPDYLVEEAEAYAYALVEKMKQEREG